MRMPDGDVRVKPAVPTLQRKCAVCNEEDKEEPLQRKTEASNVSGQAELSTAPVSVNAVLNSSGQPLTSDTRAFFEPRFGHNFSRVRVHSDAPAAQSARDVNAKAHRSSREKSGRTRLHPPRT
jgi:hypothetical protein